MLSTHLDTTKVVALMKELVEMPTVTSDKATNRIALQWIKRQLEHLPLHFTDLEHEGFGTLIATTRRTKHPRILLNAHIDVVPAAPEEFIFREENGRYYGRGVHDMKFAAAVFIVLLQELGDRLPEYDLGVVFTTDEEAYAGAYGVGHMMQQGWGADIVIDPDAITPAWTIQRAGKGTVRYRLTSRGKSGHGSRPWMYHNAIDDVINFFSDLRTRFPTEPCQDIDHAHSTLNIGTISGGAAINQVADHAEATFEIRIAPDGSSIASTQEIVQQVASPYEGIHLEALFATEPISVDLNMPYTKRLQSLITDVTGQTNEPHLAHGGSEASFYALNDIPTLLFEGPGGNNHGAGEWLDAEGLKQFTEIIYRFVESEAPRR